jgi:hypothetical protein
MRVSTEIVESTIAKSTKEGRHTSLYKIENNSVEKRALGRASNARKKYEEAYSVPIGFGRVQKWTDWGEGLHLATPQWIYEKMSVTITLLDIGSVPKSNIPCRSAPRRDSIGFYKPVPYKQWSEDPN